MNRRQIESFFAEYEKLLNNALGESPTVDTRGVARQFAKYFVSSGPQGVSGGKNGWLFRFMIPRGYAHYRKIGTQLMKVESIDVTELDPLHALAKVHWDSRYQKDGREVKIEFDVTYILTLANGAPQIFAFVTGDEEKALKAHGLTE